jgi:uncharacterized protein YjbI with pentapeptide repeats
MNTTKKIALLLLVVFGAFSCDEVDDLTDIIVDDDFSTEITVSVAENTDGEPESFAETAIIDLASNQDVQDNLSAIEDVNINSLTYEITNFSGSENATVTEASINFEGTVIAVSDINLEQSDLDNTVYSIEDSSVLNDIANTLLNGTTVTVSLSGTVDATPVTFDVVIVVDATVTIDLI